MTIMDNEKVSMHRVRRMMNHIVIPAFISCTAIILIIIIALLSTDEKKYTNVGILLFILIGILCIALLAAVPFVRKKEIALELARFANSKITDPLATAYHFTDRGNDLTLTTEGLALADAFYLYEQLHVKVESSAKNNQIQLYFPFLPIPTHFIMYRLMRKLCICWKPFR